MSHMHMPCTSSKWMFNVNGCLGTLGDVEMAHYPSSVGKKCAQSGRYSDRKVRSILRALLSFQGEGKCYITQHTHLIWDQHSGTVRSCNGLMHSYSCLFEAVQRLQKRAWRMIVFFVSINSYSQPVGIQMSDMQLCGRRFSAAEKDKLVSR